MRPPSSPAFVSADPLVGTVLGGRYRLSEVLGAGGMGTVYRATRTDTGQAVAVKLLRRELAGSPEARARFEREARAAARLEHKACVTVRDFGVDDAGLYLVMELAKGQPLSRVIARGPLGPDEAARIAERVLAGLAHAHGLGIVHRDLKPENVMVSDSGLAKILDFGVARLLGEPGTGTPTNPGAVFGTPEYLSPEQCLGEPGDFRSDLYAVGVLLFEMLTGGRPFHGDTPREIYAQHIGRPAEAPSGLAPDAGIAAALDQVVLRALAKSPSERFPDAEAMRAALLVAVPSAAAPELWDEPQGRAPWTSPGWASPGAGPASGGAGARRRRGAISLRTAFAAAGALVVALGLGSFALSRACATRPADRRLVARATASEAALGAVRSALDRGDVVGAQRLAEALVHDNPDDPRAYLLLGHALCASRDKQRGLAAYREAVRLDRPHAAIDAELWANLRATFSDRRHGEAAFVLAAELGPGAGRLLREFADETRDKKLKARALAAAEAAAGPATGASPPPPAPAGAPDGGAGAAGGRP